MDSFEHNLTNKLYRHDCPSTLELGEFHLGMNVALKAHISHCRHCSAELAELKAFMGETSSESVSFLDKARIFVADLLQPSANVLLGGAQPVLRGENDKPALPLLQFGDYVVSLSLNNGMLIGDLAHKEGVLEFAGWSSTLTVSNKKEIQIKVDIDADGGFVIENLAEGVYDLTIQGNETEIHLTNLQV